MNWYFMKDGERKGPVNLEGLKELIDEGEIAQETHVWNKSMGEEWVKVADVPALKGAETPEEEAARKEQFRKKMAEREELLAVEKAKALKGSILKGAIAVVVLAAIVWFIKTKPNRKWGMSSATPVASLEKIEARTLDYHKMTKTELTSFQHFAKDLTKIYQYSEATAGLAENVSGRGVVTAGLDAEGNLVCLHGAFPSPGMRGPNLNNRSAVSIFMNELWKDHGGAEDKLLDGIDKILAQAGAGCGFADPPKASNYAVSQMLDKKNMRAIWTEFGPNTRSSMVYFEKK